MHFETKLNRQKYKSDPLWIMGIKDEIFSVCFSIQIFFPTLILIRRVGRFLVGEITTGVSGCNVHALLSKENDLKDEK